VSNNERQSEKAIHLSPYNDDISPKEVDQERMTRWSMYNSWWEKKKNIYKRDGRKKGNDEYIEKCMVEDNM